MADPTPADAIKPSEIRVGMRAMVISAPDRHCPRELLWGAGVVTFTELEGRTEVHFDNGSGGMFPHSCIRREPCTWEEVAIRLRVAGWEVKHWPLEGHPSWVWRSPSGISGSDFRSNHPDSPPEAVMQQAYQDGIIHFTYLGVLK